LHHVRSRESLAPSSRTTSRHRDATPASRSQRTTSASRRFGTWTTAEDACRPVKGRRALRSRASVGRRVFKGDARS
ncbi:hypothetical protein FRB90_010694, partial [Tulasnella sp. 427]